MKQHPLYKRYYITESSEVWDSLKEKFINTYMHTNGYVQVSIHTEDGTKLKRVHRLCCETYKQDSDFYGLDVNHINGDKTDNHIDNLEWCTRSANILHAIDNKLNPSRGETHHEAKLTDEDVRDICQMLQDGARNIDIAFIKGVHKDTISQIRIGNNWTHISKDYNMVVNRKSRLSKDNILKLYIESQNEDVPVKVLAAKYKTTTTTVLRIKNKKVHKKFIEGSLNDHRKHVEKILQK